MKRFPAAFGVTLSIAILCVALWFLHREIAELSLADIGAQVRSIPAFSLMAAVLCAGSSYAMLTAYDGLALRYVGCSIPYRTYALTSFMAYAVGHNVGIAALSGGSIRYRMYSLQGLSATNIARIIVFVAATYGLGACALVGSALLLMPRAETSLLPLPPMVLLSSGYVLLAVPAVYLAACLLRSAPVTLRSWRIALPGPAVGLGQIVVAIGDLSFAALTLYVLLERVIDVGFVPFLGIYLLAISAGLVSSVPGGLGVFEAVLVALMPSTPMSALLGTVVVYRLIYYVTPLCIALSILVIHEVRQHRGVLRRSSERIGDLLSGIAPQIAGIVVFLAGVVLLVSGASPAVESRLRLIADGLPLPVLELSHMAGSVVGVVLLVLARGLYVRLRLAYVATLLALGCGIVFSLLKGLDYEEASILGVIGIVLWTCRARFHRIGSPATTPLPAAWITAVVIALCVVVWVALVSFRRVAYTHQLWWQFAFDADAPRTLRASVVAAMTLLAFSVWKALRAAPRRAGVSGASLQIEKIRAVLVNAEDSSANAALLGDKRFLWSPDERAFIMYRVSGSSWIAFGDPVGPAACHEELVWAFRELVDRHHGRPVFYQVSDRVLPLYIDLGLSLSKLGEDGRVALDRFSLRGPQRADFRQAVNRAKRVGAVFEVVPRTEVPGMIADLRRVSDRWLAEKAVAEKGFSLGAFSERYIENFDCAVVRVGGAIVAFANLWPAPASGEVAVDLMRYDERAPKGVMDYLFAELMLWAAAHDYRWFGLGMAPLSGMEQRALAPLWHKLGHLIFTHGEGFYNFEGLRAYKEKFEPEWRPRYLACPGGWFNLPWALIDASRLISGGVAQLLKK